MTQTNKNSHIETLRGIAILLVVIGHVIGSTPEGGMRIDFPSPWRYLYLWIDYIQMPLFTAIAGWVYALKPVKAGSSGTFMKRKAYRLLVPMAVAATLYFLIQYITPGTNQKGNLADIRIPIHDLLVSAIPVLDVRGHPYDRCQQMDG